jgi:signal transduction histidine kinase/DNA-binding NarL/FixJ family response regulator
MRALLVEDNPGDVQVIQRMLEERAAALGASEFELRHTDRLSSALELVGHVDVVLLDLSLPDSRGIDTLRHVRARAPDKAIVVLTGLDDEVIGTQAVQEGAQEFLVKGRMDAAVLAHALRYAVERNRWRVEAETQAKLSAALARVGREMISSLDAPVLLDGLCRVTTEVLECDFSHTWLWQPTEDVYTPVAGYGFPPEQWESLRLIRIPGGAVAGLAGEEVMQIVVAQYTDRMVAALARQYGVTVVLNAALRRGSEIVGFQTSGYRGRPEPFADQQVRLAARIAQMASLALEHVRVVEQLEHAHRIKSNFVATMSHELRRSLSAIVGYADLLLGGTYGLLSVEQLKVVDQIARSGWESLDVIKSTLDLSRFESKRIALELKEVSIPELIDEITAEQMLQRRPAGVEIKSELSPDVPTVRTDRVKLKMVLNNLVGNAVKFTEHGAVTIAARPEDGGIQIAVSDTGIGIPPAVQAVIFEPFRQADGTIHERYGGAGLGLYIVRRLLEMLGGTISVDSGPGQGSTFRVWIPRHASA